MSKAKKEEATNNEHDPKIDAIKEIIFGHDMREYQKRFDEMRDYIDENVKQINSTLDEIKASIFELEKKIGSDLSSKELSLNKQLELIKKEKLDRDALSDMLKIVAEKIST